MTPRPGLRSVALLLLSLALVVSVAAGAGAAATTTSAVGFANGQMTEQRGDVASIQLQLVNTDDATLLIRSPQRDYSINLQVYDRNSDGTVTIQFNTFHGIDHPGEPAFQVAGEDDVTVLYQSADQQLPVLDAGRYNLIASTGGTRVAAVLHLEESDVGGSQIGVTSPDSNATAPDQDGSEDHGTGDDATTDDAGPTTETADDDGQVAITVDQPQQVARGDQVESRFEISGVGGAVRSEHPGQNLVFANDSSPGAETTHLLQHTPNQSTEMRSITIDYDAGDDQAPSNFHRLSREDIDTLGVDRNGDGTVDQSLKVAISGIRTDTSGVMTISFDRPIAVSDSGTILAEYDVTNPETTNADTVAVTLNGEHTETGTVAYGPAGDGTLGYGVDLRLETDEGTAVTAPLAVTSVEYDGERNELVARTDTESLATDDYAVRLTIRESSPLAHSRVTLRERFTVDSPSVEIEELSATDAGLAVTAGTNLAPANQLIIQVQATPVNGGSSYLSQCVAPIQSDGTLTCEFDLDHSPSEYSIEVSVIQNGSVIAGPVAYE